MGHLGLPDNCFFHGPREHFVQEAQGCDGHRLHEHEQRTRARTLENRSNARAQFGRRNRFGPLIARVDRCHRGWFDENSSDTTHPVGQKAGNGFGLHDMHGNVYEWCADVYNQSFYGTPEAAGLDPVCTSGSESQVWRGGAFYDLHDFVRCACRSWYYPEVRVLNIGFRVVASPPP